MTINSIILIHLKYSILHDAVKYDLDMFLTSFVRLTHKTLLIL